MQARRKNSFTIECGRGYAIFRARLRTSTIRKLLTITVYLFIETRNDSFRYKIMRFFFEKSLNP